MTDLGGPYGFSLNEILASNTGQSLKKIERDTDRDYIMSAEEAVAYGMVDKVITRAEEAATNTAKVQSATA